MATKRFFRSLPKKGFSLYWILLAYLVAGYFYPVIGFLALVCMIAPVAFAVRKAEEIEKKKVVVWQRVPARQFL